jgi:hypothetical protein
MSYDAELAELMKQQQQLEDMDLASKEKAYENLRRELDVQRANLQKNYQALVGRKHDNDLLQTVARDYADYYQKIKKKMEEVNGRMTTINNYLENVIQENQMGKNKMDHLVQDQLALNKSIETYRAEMNKLL